MFYFLLLIILAVLYVVRAPESAKGLINFVGLDILIVGVIGLVIIGIINVLHLFSNLWVVLLMLGLALWMFVDITAMGKKYRYKDRRKRRGDIMR